MAILFPMKVILSFVTSLDGYVTDTKGRPPYFWASPEDQKHFEALKRTCRVVIMGRHTYEAQKDRLTLSPKILRIVMTKNPKAFAKHAVPGQLEFTAAKPRKVLDALGERGYKQVLLAAGPTLARLFLAERLVSGLYLMIEPILFGGGIPLGLGPLDKADLKLISARKINTKGTLALRYRINTLRPSRHRR